MKKWLLLLILVTSTMLMAQIVAPTNLTGLQSGEDAAVLNWSAPVLPFGGFEDFESGEVPADFSFYDVNGGNTWGIQAGGYESNYCISCLYDSPNDDWMVSPELAVTASSEFSFMAGNYNSAYAEESFNIYINSVGPEVENFTGDPTLSYIFPADIVTWESFTIDLAEFAGQNIWIAIQCTSDYMYYLKIDNYTVTNMAEGRELVFNGEENGNYYKHIDSQNLDKAYSKLIERDIRPGTYSSRAFLGYNVYRDDVQINPETVTATTYLDAGLALGSYSYYVTAVYDEGESDPTETVDIDIITVQDADEGFESGDLAQMPWVFPAEGTWSISEIEPFSGTYCIKTDSLADNSDADISVTLNVLEDGDVMFASKVSSELDWDFLSFYIDGELQNQISGTTEWILPVSNIFAVTAGIHTFSWIYEKDANTTGGADCAWLDHISFPNYAAFGSASGTVTNSDNEALENVAISLASGMFNIDTDASGNFSFPSLPAGTYAVTATLENYYEFTGSFEVVAEQNTVLDIVMNPFTAGISGTITNGSGELLENVNISLQDTMYTAVSGVGGTFEFLPLPAGTYSVTATLDNYYDYSGSVEAIDAQITNLDIVMDAFTAASLSGTITDTGSSLAIAGAIVSLDNSPDYTATTDDSGNYTISDITSDFNYNLVAYAPGFSTNTQSVFINSGINNLDISLNELLYPVSNISAELNGTDADVNWELPGTTPPDYFRYDNGLGWWGTGTFDASSIPNHAFGNAYYHQAIINSVEFCAFDYSDSGPYSESVKIIILGLGEDGFPDGNDMLYDSGWIDHVEGHENWNYHELPTPIEAVNGFFVGIRANPDTYPEFFMCTTDPTPPSSDTWPAPYGNSYMCQNVLEEPNWYQPQAADFLGSGYLPTNFMVRANGFSIEELDNRPVQDRSTDCNYDAPELNGEFTTTREASRFGTSYPTRSRAVESYNVWRLLADDIEDETAWQQIETSITALTCTDDALDTENSGTYCYAVQAEYSGDLTSRNYFSNNLGNDMYANLTISLDTASGADLTNARVRIFGDDDYSVEFGVDSYDVNTEDSNSITITAWKQVYKVYVDVEGYQQAIQEDVYLFGDSDVTITLVDEPVTAYGVNVEVQSNYVDISWLPASESVIMDHSGPEYYPIFMNDYPITDSWADYDREGAFDIIINEPVVITKLKVECPIYFTPTQNCYGEFYATPVSFSVKLYNDNNGEPEQVSIDSTSTIAVMQNDFQEYEAVFENGFALAEGTYWIGFAPILGHAPAFPTQPDGSPWGADVDIVRTTALYNNTGMAYRMPNYTGPDWNVLTSDLQAYVVGRPLTPADRSVETYDVYRLLTDDMDDPDSWIEIATEVTETSCIDGFVLEAEIYRYAVIANFPNGQSEAVFSAEEMIPMVAGDNPAVPAITKLQGNYPNPFNPATKIQFSLKENQKVKLEIFNIRGQKVKTLCNEELAKGPHSITWLGQDNNDNSVSSGIYFYRMNCDKYSSTKKMILLK